MRKFGAKKYTKKQLMLSFIIIAVIIVAAIMLENNPPQSITANANSSATASIAAPSSKNDSYITSDKYDKIKSGMTYDEVKKIIGSDGKNIFESGDKGTGSYQISYMWIGENGGEATISFSGKSKLKVLMKSQSGLK